MSGDPSKRCLTVLTFAALIFHAGSRLVSAQVFLPIYEKGSGEFELDYTIGGDIEDDDYFLARPVDIALDRRGNLFVLDGQNYCIKKFDPEGRFLKTFGGKGEGPGEMLGPLAIEAFPDGRILLNDFRNHRFTLYDYAGDYLETRDLNEFGWRFIAGIRADATGKLYLRSTKMDFEDVEQKTQTLISCLDLDSMTEAMIDSATFLQTYSKVTNQGSTMVSAPYYPELLWGVGPGGDVVVANSSDYSIKIYSADLALLRETTYKGSRRPVTKEDKEEYFAAFKGEDLVTWMRQNVDFPKYRPYFDRLTIDSDGYMLFLVDERDDDTQVFDVFTPEAEFLNRVMFPRTHSNTIFSGGFVYTIVRGEEEDPVVRRYRARQASSD